MKDKGRFSVKDIAGGVTASAGFSAGSCSCGIKPEGKADLALIVSDVTASCAGMFTINRIKGAPVLVSRENVKKGTARAIVANSGNANVCLGEDGISAALAMTSETARCIGCDPTEVLVASTGVIGRTFPVGKVLKGIPKVIADLSPKNGYKAAAAIMTTDTVPKETSVEIEIGGVPVKIGAIAKGSGMISPDMATMFCFITTDAAVEPPALRKSLRTAVDMSFNCITVDGDMSTSDTVLVLANGMAGNPVIKSRQKAFDVFSEGLSEVCLRMAKAIVRDGEGATHFITIKVTGAAGKDDARQVGLSIANSPLVKTAFFGNDPNWGRIICAAGNSGVWVEESRITITINGAALFDNGKIVSFKEDVMHKKLSARDINIDIDLGMGQGEATIYTSDLSCEYVKINADYTT